jgi:ABC-2 type transport system ATP-binding protein
MDHVRGLNIERVSYQRHNRLILKECSAQLFPGDCVALIGNNGAGKTTFLDVVSGAIQPQSGHVFHHARLGYAMDEPPVYGSMTVYSYLAYMGILRGVDSAELDHCVTESIALLELGDVQSRWIGRLSKGYKQRVGLAQAIIHQPDILLLDEPTSGFDPHHQQQFGRFIKRYALNRIVLMSSHRLDEVVHWCNRILLMEEGQVKEVGLEEIRDAMGMDVI